MTETLAAEWHKLRTARATQVAVGVLMMFAGLMLVLAWWFVTAWDALPPEGRAHASLVWLPNLMGYVASLCMAVFGALSITTEYTSGMIATTFLAMPSRRRVLAAKALVVGVVTFVTTEVAVAVTLVGSAGILASRPIQGQAPVDAAGVIAVVAIGLSTTVFALIGLGLGTISRSALVSVVALMLAWYIAPLLATHAPAPWDTWLMSVLPGALAGELAGTGNADSVFGSALSPLGALTAMVAYAAVPLGVAAVVVSRRDA